MGIYMGIYTRIYGNIYGNICLRRIFMIFKSSNHGCGGPLRGEKILKKYTFEEKSHNLCVS